MQIRAFARFAQNYAVRVSEFVRQPSLALNSLVRARVYGQRNPHAQYYELKLVLQRVAAVSGAAGARGFLHPQGVGQLKLQKLQGSFPMRQQSPESFKRFGRLDLISDALPFGRQ